MLKQKTQQKKVALARGPSLSSFTPSIGRGSVRGTPPPPARMRGAPTSRQKQKYSNINSNNYNNRFLQSC